MTGLAFVRGAIDLFERGRKESVCGAEETALQVCFLSSWGYPPLASHLATGLCRAARESTHSNMDA